ncbi:Gastricsin [Gracilariopsis chorda]|uniref:Gastricsin n=1 Tax=Gracilariopsis chorda TaxID=448386 RepID=A0A2V3J2F8_9FLOR|nr:Gastricsin [Gracilariopsis chorda]|eukprot:PXF48559.1 Gastricsin [Gracilariopsis chorda]
MPISLCLFTLSFLFVSCAARSVSLTLEKRQPKPLLPNSTRGFPQHLQIHSLEPYNPTGSIADSRSSRLRWTSRYHNVQLYGGLVAVGEYYAKVKIGGQTLRVQIDTGSATLAVPLKECVKCKRGDMRYSLKDSKTGVAQYINCDDDECGADTCSPFGCSRCSASRACCASLDEKKCAFHLRFGDGSGAEGALIYDIMSWGDVDFPVHAGGIMSDSDDFERSQVDGILGMAYPSLACNPSCIKPTFESMLEKHTDMKEMFTICITYDSGKIVLGDYDQSLSSKPIAWVPLDLSDPPSFYSFPLKGNMRIDDNELILPSYSRAIVDSGTTLIVFSRSSFSALKSYLQQHFCHVPGLCDPDSWFRPAHCTRIQDEDRNALPTLVFEVEGFNITLGPSDYLINYASKGRDFWCVGIMKLDSMSGGVDVIFGNTVMKKYVTVYDRENKRVGFAESDANCGLTSRDSVPQSLPVSSPVDPKGNTKGEASSTSENESNAESSSSNTEGATSGSGNASAGNQSNTKKQKHQPRAGSGSVLCAQATNCSACALMKDKCTWDGGSQICVAGEGFPLMCTLDNLADKFVYVIGGAVVATVTLVAIVAIVIRKRNATSEAGGEEQEPLAQSENATREAFALEDGDEEEMA